MKSSFWPIVLVFAPVWAWLPIGLLYPALVYVVPAAPPALRWAPGAIYVFTFAPAIYGYLSRNRTD